MSPRLLFCLAAVMLIGCNSGNSTPAGSNSPQPQPASITGPQYLITGGVSQPGPRPLEKGEKVSTALAENVTDLTPPYTVVLVRHGPEGKTRELINVGANGKLMTSKQDYLLRDGDELVLPNPTTRHE